MKILKSLIVVVVTIVVIATFSSVAFIAGYIKGHNEATGAAQIEIDSLLSLYKNGQISVKASPSPVATNKPTTKPIVKVSPSPWGGPALWDAVNARRRELGVNPLSQRDEICTIASIRLNELLDRGSLDGHEGFSTLPERRPDLKYIYEKYTLTEFLIQGAQSPQDAVASWENTLGHKKLLTGGEYVWGCIYAQNTFAVAITAY